MDKINFKEIINFFKKNYIELQSTLNENSLFTGINSLNNSTNEELTFFHNTKYLSQLKLTNAKACFIQKVHTNFLNKNCIPIIVEDPYLAYALVTNLLFPSDKSNGSIHKTACISKDTIIGKNVQINQNVVIKNNCLIKDNAIIYENSVIGPYVEIGNLTKIMSGCIINNSLIGKNCLIQSGVVIGGKGFGFTPKQKIEVKHIGKVIIGNNVDIGSNTTIDRGTINATIINDNCRIDNLVQIAHNVQIGKNTIIASQTGISGSTKLGDNCIIGGQVGFAGHLTIGNNVIIAAKSGVTKNFDNNVTIGGFPARDIKEWRKSIAKLYVNK